MAKNRLEKSGDAGNIEFSLLDVITQRPLSAEVAETLDVWHESPQAILIINGKAVYDESHISIRMNEIKDQCAAQENR
jgi:bacillithiol system protein YtxJ